MPFDINDWTTKPRPLKYLTSKRKAYQNKFTKNKKEPDPTLKVKEQGRLNDF